MPVLSTFTQPTTGIRHVQPSTSVFVDDDCVGKGTLYIAESKLFWKSEPGNGFAIDYPHIGLHGISRDLNSFPQECIFLMLDTKLDEDGCEENESDSDSNQGTTMRLVPDDKGMLDAMFHALNACQSLHPDEMEENSESDEDSFEDAPEETPADESDDFRMAGLTIENMDEFLPEYMSEEWGVGREPLAAADEQNGDKDKEVVEEEEEEEDHIWELE